MIFRPFDLNTLLTSFLVLSISFGMVLQAERPLSWYSATSSLNLDAVEESV